MILKLFTSNRSTLTIPPSTVTYIFRDPFSSLVPASRTIDTLGTDAFLIEAMSVFTSIYRQTLGRVVSSHVQNTQPGTTPKKRKLEAQDNNDNETISRRRKREGSDEDKEIITKKRRINEGSYAPIVDGETYESTAIEAPLGSHEDHRHASTYREADRYLMPPPPLTPMKTRVISRLVEEGSRRVSMDMDSVSQFSLGTRATQQKAPDEAINDYDMERARRHAAATSLPANSGVWERGEKELFFHLSYRGFEPLLPRNWMKDFPTMPLSLYEREDEEEPPLIQVHKTNGEFRAIRELRELLDIGKNVRDKVLSSPGVKREGLIEKAMRKYVSWALGDVGIKPSTSANAITPLPIHVVVKLKSRQTTTDCLLEMKQKLHALRTRHCRARDIQASVERHRDNYETPESEEETWIADSSEDDLPVLYGIMICKSILAIFTLNSRTPAPRMVSSWPSVLDDSRPSPAATESIHSNAIGSVTSTEANLRLKRSILANGGEQELEDDSASDPRFISDFDFSDSAKDVWNALVIAIVAMQIRRDMLLLNEGHQGNDSLEDIRAGIEENSIMDIDDDPDA